MNSFTPYSSNIASVAWNENKLHITFKGGSQYTYENVPQSAYFAFARAKSAGSHFAEFVKDKYTFAKVK